MKNHFPLYNFWSHSGLIRLNSLWSYFGHMVDIYLFTFVKRANNRSKILHLLSSEEKTQAQLHHESKLYRTHVRRTLLELQEKKLVKCLNPKDRIYKLYKVTAIGKEVLNKIENAEKL